MVRASVPSIIHSLTVVDYLSIQTHKPYSNYRIGGALADETSLDLRNAIFTIFTFNRNMTNNDDGVEKEFVVS